MISGTKVNPMGEATRRFGFLGMYQAIISSDDTFFLIFGGKEHYIRDLHDYNPKTEAQLFEAEISRYTGTRIAKKIVDWITQVYC